MYMSAWRGLFPYYGGLKILALKYLTLISGNVTREKSAISINIPGGIFLSMKLARRLPD
jgi:hypothetical protein